MIKSFKVRLFPTKKQEQLMWRHIGACRYLWNFMLDFQQENYKQGNKYLSAFDMINMLKPMKNDGEHEWLKEVSNTSLKTICRDLDRAFHGFFKKQSGYPKFKSRKRSKPAFPIRETVWFTDRVVTIEKVGKVRYKTDFELPSGRGHKFTNPRISNVNGKWMLSFGIEFVQADRFYPSSKTCSCCGNVKQNLKLSDRVYECESCGLVIDRDYNAAINLSRYAA